MKNQKQDNPKTPAVDSAGAHSDSISSLQNDDKSNGEDPNCQADAAGTMAASRRCCSLTNVQETAPSPRVHQHGERTPLSLAGIDSASEKISQRKKPPAKSQAVLPTKMRDATFTTARASAQADSSTAATLPITASDRASVLLAQKFMETELNGVLEPNPGDNSASDDDGKRAALDDRTIMARALGISGCDFKKPPFNAHKRMCSPSKRELFKEFKRRLPLLGIKPTKVTRHKYPNFNSPVSDLAKWLRQNPIRDENEIRELKEVVKGLKTRIAGASRAPRQKKSQAPRQHEALSGEAKQDNDDDDDEGNNNSNRHKAPSINERNGSNNTNDGQKMLAHTNCLSEGQPTAENNTFVVEPHYQDNNDPTKRQEEAAAIAGENVLSPRDLMARSLGLPGCHFQQRPFCLFPRTCAPTVKQLYAEFKRRCGILGIDLTRNDRSLLPADNTRKPDLVLWLVGHPIPNNHTEVGSLLLQVESLRMWLETGDFFSDHPEDTVGPEEEQPPLQPREHSDENTEGETIRQHEDEWMSLPSLNWSDTSGNSSTFDTGDAQSIDPSGDGTVPPLSLQQAGGETSASEWKALTGEDKKASNNSGADLIASPSPEETTLLADGALSVSSFFSHSETNQVLGGRELVDGIFESNRSTSSHTNGASGETSVVVSFGSAGSPATQVSPLDPISKTSTTSSSRLTVRYEDLMRLRGGRGPLDALKENGNETTSLTLNKEDAWSEVESMSALSDVFTVEVSIMDNAVLEGVLEESRDKLVGSSGGTIDNTTPLETPRTGEQTKAHCDRQEGSTHHQ